MVGFMEPDGTQFQSATLDLSGSAITAMIASGRRNPRHHRFARPCLSSASIFRGSNLNVATDNARPLSFLHQKRTDLCLKSVCAVPRHSVLLRDPLETATTEQPPLRL